MILRAVGVLIMFTLKCGATVLDFNAPSVAFQEGYGGTQSYLEDGFRFTTVNGGFIRFNPATNSFAPNDGTVHLGTTLDSRTVFEAVDGSAFALQQLDLAPYSAFFSRPNLSLSGDKMDGSIVSATLAIPTQLAFQTYQLSPAWNNLRRVRFLSDGFAVDNIVVSPVPEASTVLFGAALAGSCLLARNRKARR